MSMELENLINELDNMFSAGYENCYEIFIPLFLPLSPYLSESQL